MAKRREIAKSIEIDGNLLLETGSTGLHRAAGYVYEEWHPQLRGQQASKVYREMVDNDAVVGAIMWAIKMLVRQAPWRVDPAQEGSPEAQAVADFVEECRLDMEFTWQEFLSEALQMLPFGFALFEKVYKVRRGRSDLPQLNSRYNDGLYGIRKLATRSQETIVRWEFSANGDWKAAIQNAPPTYHMVRLPAGRLVNFRLDAYKNSPEGRSMLRPAYRSWYYLKRIQEIEAIGIERDLAGLPVVRVPVSMLSSNATTAQKAAVAAMYDMVQKIRRDHLEGVVFPASEEDGKKTGFDISLLSSGGRRPIDVNEIVKRYESRIAMSALAEFILLGMQGGAGASRALHSSKADLFKVAIGAVMDAVSDTWDRSIIPELCAINNIPLELCPKLWHGDIESPDVDVFVNAVATALSGGALTAGDDVEEKVRDVIGLPPKPEMPLGQLTAPDPNAAPEPAIPELPANSAATKGWIQRVRSALRRPAA